MPWERDVYIGLLSNHIKEENERIKQQQMRGYSNGRRRN